MKVAFYAPIKPPDHPIATGDRLIARLLIRALEMAGHEVTLASHHIAYAKRPERLEERKAQAIAAANAAIESLRSNPPDIAFTYHPYCKAPDWIGPRIADAFAIPYVTVEAARASVTGAEWEPWRREARGNIARADLHVWLKPTDRAMLLKLLGPDAPLAPLAPFIDIDAVDTVEGTAPRPDARHVVVVGQMRPGKKARNHRIATQALDGIDTAVTVLGDGPERDSLAPLYPPQAVIRGAVPWEEVVRTLRSADVLLWPGWREPIGMVYLEAAACGVPAVATADMGVPLVVEDGASGLLVPPISGEDDAGGIEALRRALAMLLRDTARRERLGLGAREKAVSNHSLPAASRTLDAALRTALASLGATRRG